MDNLRPCIADGHPATFHKWAERITYDAFMKQHLHTVGIVEYDDGSIHEVTNGKIIFVTQKEHDPL